MQETWVISLGQEDPLEEETATHSSIPAYKTPWQRRLKRYSPWGHKRVAPHLATKRQQQQTTATASPDLQGTGGKQPTIQYKNSHAHSSWGSCSQPAEWILCSSGPCIRNLELFTLYLFYDSGCYYAQCYYISRQQWWQSRQWRFDQQCDSSVPHQSMGLRWPIGSHNLLP